MTTVTTARKAAIIKATITKATITTTIVSDVGRHHWRDRQAHAVAQA